jgi:biopolymer transport protein ExbD
MVRRGEEDGGDSNMLAVVTPFLDMTFQLLFFFMMNYNPSDLEGQMELNLPDKAESQGDPNPNPTPSGDVDPKFESDVTVVLKTQHGGQFEGAISLILVEDKSAQQTPVNDPNALLQYLTKLREGLENKESIKLQGDSRLKWSEIVKIMDICRKAEFKDVSFSPPLDLGQ